ncbi:hypothetical protein VHEMI06287 [[Torrubiella] hemipterigena]|uniref:RNA polymerase-associated protein LEO1 n=1 Tax=[Torrubiella] hemipterigena TaxID=1531966 RepID=A0A0A1T6S8_9HYPO|nr:hypothetical protein VHEMI06287 [[Torrubiella] hemipterigena]
MSDSDEPIDHIDEEGDDLFGDDDGDAQVSAPRQRVLEDDDLASDPDEDRDAGDYGRYDGDAPQETHDRVVMGVTAYRHRIPKPKDGALRVMRVPKFFKIMPQEYVADSFEPTEFDIDNAKAENPAHVARVRRDATTGDLKSNTNIYRWSDGSVTISIGGEQYEIQKKALAPGSGQDYDELKDGHYYAAAAELTSNLLLTVGHVTEQFTVRPNKAVGDDALSVLAQRMAQASKQVKEEDMIIRTTEDPELQKKRAEAAEKERATAQRRRENAAAKMDGLGRYRSGGLSIGDLEGGRRAGGPRKRGLPGTKPKRRRPEYDSDDDLPQGVGRQEEYDKDDGFLVDSDDEEFESGADDDDEEMLDDERPSKSKRRRTPESGGDEDMDDHVETSGRSRRRNVVDDEDEED